MTKPGAAADSQGNPVIDPTKNVLDLVAAAIKRQDDLREAADRHIREMLHLRTDYQEQLRNAESDRIDAIRAVDVAAVQRAAEVSMQQAATLAAQQLQSAETLRSQVALTATASTVALAAALQPIQKDIADLRKSQYEAQGVRSNVGESKQTVGVWIALAVLLVAVISLVVALISK